MVKTLSTKAQALKDVAGKDPTPENIVKALSKYMETCQKDCKGTQKDFLVYSCPKHVLGAGGRIYMQKGSGYGNGLTHLLSCCYKGDKDALMNAYWERKTTMIMQSHPGSFFSTSP